MSDFITRRCGLCKDFKPNSAFTKNIRGKDGLSWECKECKAAANRDWHATKGRNERLNRNFGITDVEYVALLDKQGGVCALCGTDDPRGRWGMFNVDHCHDTGRIRGLLCMKCNSALGVLGDTPSTLLRAYEYVRGPEGQAA